MNAGAGVLGLKRPLTRSFPAPSIARVTSLATTNVGVRNMTVQGTEPLAVTETVGFTAENNHFVIDTTIGGGNVTGLNLNTLVDFQFIGNTFTSVGPRYADSRAHPAEQPERPLRGQLPSPVQTWVSENTRRT